jgi:hypothetical protein
MEATMADKDVERNVRSTTVEGIKTPTERHVQGIGERHTVAGEKYQEKKTKQSLLEKFRTRELRKQGKVIEGEGGGEPGGPAENAGGEDTDE